MSSIPVFVINLDRRTDRMREMERRLFGVCFMRVPAVDGRELGALAHDGDVCEHGIYRLTSGEMGCIQSHKMVNQWIVDERIPFACVLEDDVVLSESLYEYIKSNTWIPEGVDLIKIETMNLRVWLSRKKKPVQSRNLHKLCSFHPGTGGYIISLTGAKKMIEILSDPDQAADDLMFKRAVEDGQFGEIWQMVPALCIQEFVYSDRFTESDILRDRDGLRSASREKPKGLSKFKRELQRPFLQLWGKHRCFTESRRVVDFE